MADADLKTGLIADWRSRVPADVGFLSARNPLATKGQRLIEDRAIALMQRPELVHASAIVRALLMNVAKYPLRDQADRLDAAINEHMFHHAFRAANGDANAPEVGRFMVPPHHWFGRDVPGSRWGGDSPDFIYRTIPIAHGGRYEIHGVPTCAEAPIVFWALMSDNTAAPQIQGLLESLDMEFEHDGRFVITVDATPANGRRNHIQTKPGSEFIMIRDAFGDWLNQSANALTVTRLDPDGAVASEDAMAQRAAKIALEGVYYAFFMWQGGHLLPPNEIAPPASTAAMGAIASQWGTLANIELEDDEAIVIRTNAAGAGFRNAFLFDPCFMTNGYAQRTASFNMKQMAPDADGDFTYVIAHHDPGVANWLDTGGLRRTLFGQRWQGFARGQPHDDPWMTMKHVKLGQLAKNLPDGVRTIDATARKAQLAARAAGYASRFVDN